MIQSYLLGNSKKEREIKDISLIFYDKNYCVWTCQSLNTGKIGESNNVEEAYVCSLQAHARALKHQEDYVAEHSGDLGEMVLGKPVQRENESDGLLAYPFNQLKSIMDAASTINSNVKEEKGFVYFSDTVKMAIGEE